MRLQFRLRTFSADPVQTTTGMSLRTAHATMLFVAGARPVMVLRAHSVPGNW